MRTMSASSHSSAFRAAARAALASAVALALALALAALSFLAAFFAAGIPAATGYRTRTPSSLHCRCLLECSSFPTVPGKPRLEPPLGGTAMSPRMASGAQGSSRASHCAEHLQALTWGP